MTSMIRFRLRKRTFGILSLVVAGSLACWADAAMLDVYILTGQSNSLGTTALEGGTEAAYGPGAHAADGMHTVIGEIAASDSNNNRKTTTQQQMDLAAGDPAITFVATSDLPLKSDGIHFGRDEKLAIGARFADALLVQVPEPSTLALLALGVAMAMALGHRRRR